MILGIGTDIIEIERIKVAIERTPSFLSKAFTEKERELFKSKGMRVETIAGNFAGGKAQKTEGWAEVTLMHNSRPWICALGQFRTFAGISVDLSRL